MASEGCMDKACVKARLPDHQKCKPKKNRHYYGDYMLNELPVLDWKPSVISEWECH